MLIELIHDDNSSVREAVIEAIGNIGSEESLSILLETLESSQLWTIRMKAAQGLGKIGSDQVVPRLIKALEDSDKYVRDKAVEALSKINEAATISQYLPDLSRLLITESGKDAIRVINFIQAKCEFYDYKIEQQAEEFRKADRASLEGGGDDRTTHTTINHFPNAIDVKIFEQVDAYHETPPKDPKNQAS
jgi:HEAT repeats/HEAT repeat